jgi:hypothetical protein
MCVAVASLDSASAVSASTARHYAKCSIQAIAGKALSRRLSTDHDPLFRFHRWLANLRVVEIAEIKSVPYAPMSHPFVERLIGTIRREYVDCTFFWNSIDLRRNLEDFRRYYNGVRVHRSLNGTTPYLFGRFSSLVGPRAAEHRSTTQGLFSSCLVLQDVPMFHEYPVLHNQDVGHNPVAGSSSTGKAAVQHNKIVLREYQGVFIGKCRRRRPNQVEKALPPWSDVCTMLDIVG